MKWEQAKIIAQDVLDMLNNRFTPKEVGVIVRALARLLRKQEHTTTNEKGDNENLDI